MKNCIKILLLLFCLAAMCLAACAEEYDAYYYVSSTMGEHDNDGLSPQTPRKTFTDGNLLAAANPGETVAIVFMDAYKLSGGVLNPISHSNTFVYTTNDGITDYAKKNDAKLVFGKGCLFQLGGPSRFEDITIEYQNTLSFVGNYHAVTFGKTFSTRKLNNEGNGVYVYGGYREPNDAVTEVELDSHLTFEGGEYYLVFGGSRNLGKNADGTTAATKFFEGTHYIDIRGGTFTMVYGGSIGNHAAYSANITMTGGTVDRLYMAGDQTRRLNGDAIGNFRGGHIREFQVNNTMGEAHITFDGATVDKASVLCYSDALTEMEAQADNKKVLYCNTKFYTAEQIAAYGADFDAVESTAYFHADSPASFADAFKGAAAEGGRIIVTKDILLTDFSEPAHTNAVQITGTDETVTLTLNGKYVLHGETAFDRLTLRGTAEMDATNGLLVIRKDATVADTPNVRGAAELYTGTYGTVSEATRILVDGATVNSIVGGSTKLDAEIHAGTVSALATAETATRSAKILVSGGRVEKLIFRGVTDSLSLLYTGGSIGSAVAEGNNAKGRLTLGDRMDASVLGDAASLFPTRAARVVYAKDGATGNGFSPASPASFRAAYGLLHNGGTMVLVGETTSSAAFYKAPAHNAKITLTSVYDGVDYRKSAGAKLVLASNFYLGGTTEMDHLVIESKGSYTGIFCNYNDVTFGSDVACSIAAGNNTYPSIISGTKGDIANKAGTVVIRGGDWQRLRLGSSGGNPQNVTTKVVMYGGTVHEYAIMVTTGHRSHVGNGTFEMHGGVVKGNVYGAYYSTATTVFDGNLAVILHGGKIGGGIYATKNNTGVLSGSFTVTVNGGDFSKLTEIAGGNTKSFVSKIKVNAALPNTVKISGF